MMGLPGINRLKLIQRSGLFALLVLLSGCITVRIMDEGNDAISPGVNSLPGVTEVSPTISPSPMIIPTQLRYIRISQPALKPGIWYFIAVTRQGRSITMYLDGRAVSFGDFDILNLDAPISLKFGRREGPEGFYLNGRIDEVEIYNGTALTPQQIYIIYSAGSSGKCKGSSSSNCVPPPLGLTGWWPGDNGEDLVSQRNGFLREDARIGTGLVGGAFEFNGDHEYFEVPDDPTLNFGLEDFSIDLWVNFNNLTGDQVLIEKWIQEEPKEHAFSQGWTLTRLNVRDILLAMDDGSGREIDITINIQPSSTATPTIIPTASPTVAP